MRKHPLSPFVIAFLSLAIGTLSAACSPADETGTDGGTDAASGGDGPTAPTGQQVGLFKVSLIAPVPETATTTAVDGYTSLFGKVYTGSIPQLLVWETAQVGGDCKLLTPRVPVCSTACADDEACVETNTCQKYPTALAVGNITLKGVANSTGADLTISPISNTYQIPGNVTTSFPGFAEGDQISVVAAGGQYGAFSLQAMGVAPLNILDSTITLTSGQPMTITWSPATKAGSMIHVKVDISHHGGVRGQITCDTADDGSLTIAASLVTGLYNLGVSGYPTTVISRISSDSTDVSSGHIDLSVLSEVEKAITIPGLTSCTSDEDCTSGQTCQADLQCK